MRGPYAHFCRPRIKWAQAHGTREALDRLRRAGWDIFFATNNSTATRLDYVRRLQTLGLGGDLDHIVTSA